jgi:hypothetical protein
MLSKNNQVIIDNGGKNVTARLDNESYTEAEKIFLKGCTVDKGTMRQVNKQTVFTPNCVISSSIYKLLTDKASAPQDPIQIVEVCLDSSNPFFKLADGTNVDVKNTTLFNSLFANGNKDYPSINNILNLSEELKQDLDYELRNLKHPTLTILDVINKFLEDNA